jgi:hypothetical protein
MRNLGFREGSDLHKDIQRGQSLDLNSHVSINTYACGLYCIHLEISKPHPESSDLGYALQDKDHVSWPRWMATEHAQFSVLGVWEAEKMLK